MIKDPVALVKNMGSNIRTCDHCHEYKWCYVVTKKTPHRQNVCKACYGRRWGK